jgi:hypothetical protein
MDSKLCGFYLKKNGSIKFKPDSFINYKCLENNYLRFFSYINLPNILGKNINETLHKLSVLKRIQKQNFKTLEFDKKIYIFKEENTDIFLKILYLYSLKQNRKNFFFSNIQNALTTYFLYNRFQYIKMKNSELLIMIFYRYYIDILKEIKNINLDNFSNYKELYKFLKKEGYVDIYYDKYKPYILKNYKKFYKKILGMTGLKKFINIYKSRIHNFNELDLSKVINLEIHSKKNKKIIKNKYIG